jgi:exodeoxyribonuclease X
MPFGKHRGVAMAEVPADYKRWLRGQPDVDPYLRQALER